MDRMRVDSKCMSVLAYITEPVEITDSDGTVLGRFTPDPEHVRRLYGRTDNLPSAAEILEQAKAEGPPRSTRELFEYLLTLATNPEDQADLREHINGLAERDRCRGQ